MRKSLNRIAAGAMSIAMVGSFLLNVTPVHAAPVSIISDTMTRLAAGVPGVGHVLIFTAPAESASSTWTTGAGAALTFTYPGFTNGGGTPAVSTTGGGTVTAVASGNTLVLTCTAGVCNGQTWTIGSLAAPFTFTNPSAANATEVLVSGPLPDSDTGGFSIPIMDSDQVTINASVAVATTFDIDTEVHLPNTLAANGLETAAPYVVNLGTISLSDGRVSGSTDGVNFIHLDLSSNATHGTVVTVQNTFGGAGLTSVSTPTDTIPTATATMANGTANYGICVMDTSVGPTLGGTFQKVGPYASTCAANSETNSVGGLTLAPQPILNTAAGPVTGGQALIVVNGAISNATASHNDYTDTLTFIATGTF